MAAAEAFDDIAGIVAKLVEQESLIFEMLGEDRHPQPRPPIGDLELERLRAWWLGQGARIPPSYEAFLKVCDGIVDFSVSYALFGSPELLGDGYDAEREAMVDEGLGLPHGGTGPIMVVGRSDETTTRVIIDHRVSPMTEVESIVFDGDPGFLSLHESFGAFLRMHVAANELTIAELQKGPPADDDE